MNRASRKRITAAVMTAAMTAAMLQTPTLPVAAQEGNAGAHSMQIWFDEPTSRGEVFPGMEGGFRPGKDEYNTQEDNIWQQLTLPIGNGSIGANVYGEVSRERLTFNEKTLWNGGPGESRPGYNGGNKEYASNGQKMAEVYRKVQELYLAGEDAQANAMAKLLIGESDGYGAYQSWGDIYLDYGFSDEEATGYFRNLDLLTSISNVDFVKDGTRYHREYFVSYPDQVLAMKLTARDGDKMNINISFPVDNAEEVADRKLGKEVTTVAEGGRLTVEGRMQDNQMLLNGQLLVARTGDGSVMPGEDGVSLDVKDADEVIIYVAADTDYSDEYPVYRTGDTPGQLKERVKDLVDQAAAKGYDKVKADHLADYQEIFNRVSLDLGQGGGISDKPTEEMVRAYRAGTATELEERLLETLLFQYGRYLTIASSREGDLPSNLQGIWQNRVGDAGRVPWGSDYHMNVNLQMNYWPTYSTNMIECATPLIDYINALKAPGQNTAKSYFGVTEGGFTAHTQNTPFGWTCPGWDFSWGWSPAALPWILQNCYEYYEYSGDVEYLRENIYPLLKESALLYDQILIEKDGRLVSAPAYSPEHGPVTAGNTYEQTLIWQLYEDAIYSAEVLGVDADKVRKWKSIQEKLEPIEIGDSGQIKEWYTETTLGSMGDEKHRHMSHLLGLFPGDLISVDNAEYMDAAIISLKERGYSSTGWGVGQRINAWARTGMGDGAYNSIRSLIQGGIYPNLWDSHAPFQIDGNFGYTSGVAEILMQSNMNYINILPALPSAWSNGSVNGLVARGNFEIGIDWMDGSPFEIGITSKNGGEAVVQSENIAMATVTDSNGNHVDYKVLTADRISFSTVKGEAYTVTEIPQRGTVLAAPENVKAVRTGGSSVDVAWDPSEGEGITYTVYRQIDNGDVLRVAENLTETTYTDKDADEYLGSIKYRVQAFSATDNKLIKSVMSDAAAVARPVSGDGMVDDRDPSITYTGNWDTYGEPGLYENTSTFLENPAGTETLEMPFRGTGIKVYATVNVDRGMADVYIDGQLHGCADSYAPTKINYKEIYSVNGLENGDHVIRLEVKNQKNPSSSKGKFEFDAFKVLDPDNSVTEITVNSVSGILTLAKPESELQMVAVVDSVSDSDSRLVTWSVEPADMASIDEKGLLKIGNAAGTVTVTATSTQDSAVSGSIQVDMTFSDGQGAPIYDEGTTTEFTVSGSDNNGGGTLNDDNLEWNGGGWGTWGGEEGYLNGNKVDGTEDGASVVITFTGSKIELYGAKNHTFSGFEVELDGVDKGYISVNVDESNNERGSLMAVYGGLEEKEHKLKITVKGKDGYCKVALDCFKIFHLIGYEEPVEGADKSGLQDMILANQGKYQERYTQESYSAFSDAYGQAVSVMNTAGASAADIEAAVSALERASAGLQELPEEALPKPVIPEDDMGAVKAKAVESKTLFLIWPQVENAAGYRIYQVNSLSRDTGLLGETTVPYYRVSNLNPGTAYEFRIEAVSRIGTTASFHNIVAVTLAETVADVEAPEPVTELQRAEGENKLIWKPSVSTDTISYEIWVNGEMVAEIPHGEAMEYDMSSYGEGNHRVAVTAVDGAGNHSVPVSIVFSVVRPMPAPKKITSVEAVAGLSVPAGTPFGALALPGSIQVTLDDGGRTSLELVWLKGDYDPEKEGSYTLKGELMLVEGIENPQNIAASARVMVTPRALSDIIAVTGQSLTVEYGTSLEQLKELLPERVPVQVADQEGKVSSADVNVAWDAEGFYHGSQSGIYELNGELLTEGEYTNSGNLKAVMKVTVKPEPGGEEDDGKEDDGGNGDETGGQEDNDNGGSTDGGDKGNGDTVNKDQNRRSPRTYDDSPFRPLGQPEMGGADMQESLRSVSSDKKTADGYVPAAVIIAAVSLGIVGYLRRKRKY